MKYNLTNIINKYNKNYYGQDDFVWKTVSEVPLNIENVLDYFTADELIDAIGVEKVENILRRKKLQKIKDNI